MHLRLTSKARVTRLTRLLAVAWLVIAVSSGIAQPPAQSDNVKEQAAKDDEFWFSSAKRRSASAAQLVLARNPFTIAAMRFKSYQELIWAELEFANELAPPLNQDWLDDIVDGRPLPDLRGKAKDELPKSALPTYNAFCEALIYSFQLPPDVFKKSAKENVDIKFPQLWNEPKINRGKVIPVQGRLIRVRKWGAPWPAKKEGIQDVYEGWLYGDTKHSTPYVLIFAVLPEGVPVTEKIRRQASFEGYFLGRFRFRVGPIGEQSDMDIPLFIGPTIRVAPEETVPLDDTPFSFVVLVGVVALLVGLVGVIIGISWWFQKGDNAIQTKLAARREQQTLELMNNPEQWSQPNPPPQGGTP